MVCPAWETCKNETPTYIIKSMTTRVCMDKGTLLLNNISLYLWFKGIRYSLIREIWNKIQISCFNKPKYYKVEINFDWIRN